jgi:hypothetical protein
MSMTQGISSLVVLNTFNNLVSIQESISLANLPLLTVLTSFRSLLSTGGFIVKSVSAHVHPSAKVHLLWMVL